MILSYNLCKRASAFLGLAVLIGCHRGSLSPQKSMTRLKGNKPNVLLITIDTLRADHLGCYGYDQVKTPNIDSLAEGGILFQRAFTPVPVTLPSHASILTGVYPPFHGVRNNGTFILDKQSITLAEILKDEGYQSAAVTGAYVLDSRFGLDQGFDYYDDEIDRKKEDINQLYVERKAEEVSQAAIKWLGQKSDAPFFLWVHYFDPHATYIPPSPFMMEYAGHPYDGEIAYTDEQIGVLLQYLRSRGELENTLVILTADHGESLGEHGEETHAIFLYDATLHIPLIFHYPHAFPQPKEISQLVRTIDILPSVLDVLQMKIPSDVQGENLTAFISHPESAQDKILYCETHYPALNHGWSPLEGIRTSEWKYIQAPSPELYNLTEDAKETANLITSHPREVEKIREEFLSLKKHVSLNGIQWSRGGPLDERERQKLMSLGYIWTTAPEHDNEQAPDPKDMVGTLIHLNRAISFYTLKEYGKAEAELKIILAQNPLDIFARFSLASIYMQGGKLEEALTEYEMVASKDQNFMDIHNHMGALYERMDQDEKALKEYNMAVSLNPSFAEAYNNRGALYMKLNNSAKARDDFLQAISLHNSFPEAFNNMGLSYEKEGSYAKAVNFFQQSLHYRPDYPDASNNLGCVYIKMGDYENARQALEKIVKIEPDHIEAHNNLGIVYNHLGNYERAILELEETLLLDPNYIDAYISLGIAYFEEGEYKEALRNYEKALQLNPESPQAYINLGILYTHQDTMQRAIEAYKKAVDVAPENVDAHLNLANAYRKTGQADKEKIEWESVMRLDHKNLEAYIGLGMIYVTDGRLYEALPIWQKVIELAPDDARGYISLGDLYSKIGSTDKALESYRQALGLDANNIEAHLSLGALFYHQGSLDFAIQEWQKVLSLDPQNTQAYFNLAAAFSQKGFHNEAIEAYNNLIKIDGEDAEAHFYLGLAYEQTGQIMKAAQEYRQTLRIKPDFSQAYMMLQRLEVGGGI
ncbi:MAG: tetratricopeptide repeat protein [bacterium]